MCIIVSMVRQPLIVTVKTSLTRGSHNMSVQHAVFWWTIQGEHFNYRT